MGGLNREKLQAPERLCLACVLCKRRIPAFRFPVGSNKVSFEFSAIAIFTMQDLRKDNLNERHLFRRRLHPSGTCHLLGQRQKREPEFLTRLFGQRPEANLDAQRQMVPSKEIRNR